MFKFKFKDLFKEDKDYIYPKSLNEAISMNGFSVKKQNDSNAETFYFSLPIEVGVNESEEDSGFIDDSNDTQKKLFKLKGGIIVFSTNVNAIKYSKNEIVNTVVNKITTLYNKFLMVNKLDRVLKHYEDVYGITIGAFARGIYKSQKGSMYDETSISIEIIGISTTVLYLVAKDLCKEFNQESVLVKNNQDNTIYLIYGNN